MTFSYTNYSSTDKYVLKYKYQVLYLTPTLISSAYKVKRFFCDKGDYDCVKKYLRTINWYHLFDGKDVQQMWDILLEILLESEKKYILSKVLEITGDNKYKETFSIVIRQKIKKKHNLWKCYMETRSPTVYRNYCKIRNKVKNMIKYTRKQKEKCISGNIEKNPKAFWKYTKSKTKSNSTISSLHANPKDSSSNQIDNRKEKANILNQYFASVFTNEPDGEFVRLEEKQIVQQSPLDFSIDEVRKLLQNLKTGKSPGPDGLHPRFVNELADDLCLPLYLIFKSSVNSAKIPKQWKFARVSAIFKKGNRKLACNYRPVSITSSICRILETIIRNSIVKFLVSNDLLSVYQYGFLKGRSTTLQLLKVLNDWTESMENTFSTDCIYLDYQKAFDSVPHRRLISKLRSYKINECLVNWVEDYLQNRSQFVEINGKKSQWLPVTSGIPQGSVLGPLLFLIYINDLPENVNSTVYMYADDTKIYREIQSDDDYEVLQRDLETLKTWSDRWLLKFHPSKCYCINIGKKNVITFKSGLAGLNQAV